MVVPWPFIGSRLDGFRQGLRCIEVFMTRRHYGVALTFSCMVNAAAQAPSTFTATGSMTTPRALHTATLLLDGRVLIAGGYGSGGFSAFGIGPLKSAEIYDPEAGTFTQTGDMTAPRAGH